MTAISGHIPVRRKSIGKPGDPGLPGLIHRQSEWATGIEYRNDSALTTDIRYLDIGIVTTGANTYRAFRCKKTHTSSSSITYANTTYWEEMNSLYPIYTPLIMAANAVFRFTQTNKLYVMKDDGVTVNLGMGGGDYPLWIGAPTAAGASFKVSYAGKLTATDAEITGKITATSGKIGGFNISSNYIGLADSSNSTGMSLYDSFIYFRDIDTSSGYEGDYRIYVGSNTMPASSGLRALLRLESETRGTYAKYSDQYGFIVSVKGGNTNYAIYCENGLFAGLRPNLTLAINISKTLTEMDHNVVVSNNSTAYIYLPKDPQDGQEYTVIHLTENSMILNYNSGHRLYTVHDSKIVTSFTSTTKEAAHIVYCAKMNVTSGGTTYNGVWVVNFYHN